MFDILPTKPTAWKNVEEQSKPQAPLSVQLLPVATHNTNRLGPQSSQFWDQIKCNYPVVWDRIKCNWDHIIYNWDHNHRFETTLSATIGRGFWVNKTPVLFTLIEQIKIWRRTVIYLVNKLSKFI